LPRSRSPYVTFPGVSAPENSDTLGARDTLAVLVQDLPESRAPHSLAALPLSLTHRFLFPDDTESSHHMTSSWKNTPSRKVLTGLSLGATAVLAAALAGCGSTTVSQTQESIPAAQAQNQEQPNIMMVLLDDLGYSDLGVYGGEAETPHLDALAQESAQFSNFYATPLCAPTRASLLTGQDRHRVGLGSMEGLTPPGVPETTPGYKGSLEGDYTGIAEVLGKEGYDTYQVGKWHLGEDEGQTPRDLGFDQNFTLYDAGASYYSD